MADAARGAASHGPTSISGRAQDLLLGAGGAYLLSVPLLLGLAGGASAADWPLTVVWIIAIGINGPHYGATLLRVYAQRDERRKYALFAVWATLALGLAFAVGVRERLIGSLLVTVYFTWSPWHFAGQNYGVALMFLRRSDVTVAPAAKRLLLASFALSFALSFLALHTAGSTSVQAPTRGGYAFDLPLLRLGIPHAVAVPALLACGCGYLVCLIAGARRLRREATWRQLVPVVSLVLCQALWFAVPSALDVLGRASTRSLAFAAIWISAAHSLQYLWVTFHYAERSGSETRLLPYLAKTTLAGNAAIVLPGIVFAPQLLGSDLPWEAGLSALVFAVVNLHHFVLDGAVWKLRDGRVARLLLRAGADGSSRAEPRQSRRGRWPAVAVWTAGGMCLAVEVAELTRQQAERRGAYALAGRALDGLSWLGRDHAFGRLRLGRALIDAEQYADARIQFRRSASDRPTAAAWGGLGRALAGEGDLRGAAEAYEAGLEIAPRDAALLRSAGAARLALGEPARAAAWLERALERQPRHRATQRALGRARGALAAPPAAAPHYRGEKTTDRMHPDR